MFKNKYITRWKCDDCERTGEIEHNTDPKHSMLIFDMVRPAHMDKSGLCGNRLSLGSIYKFDAETRELVAK